jgi:hypothetical protein
MRVELFEMNNMASTAGAFAEVKRRRRRERRRVADMRDKHDVKNSKGRAIALLKAK